MSLSSNDGDVIEYLVAPGNPCEEPHEALPWNLYDDA